MRTTVFSATEVTGLSEAAPGAYVLSIPKLSDFIPGQCLHVTPGPDIPPRAYSIASGRDDPEWEILFTVVPGGLLTPRLCALTPGDRILVSEPFGEFRDEEGRSVWIAAGTGVAPFASMVRSGMTAGKSLIQGSRTPDRLFYRELFQPAVDYVPCCTSTDGGAEYHGRVTEYLEAYLKRRSAALSADARYLLCGRTEMVVETRDILLARGVPFTNIAAEIYF
jgi:ferredoxin--NADP+ reductase